MRALFLFFALFFISCSDKTIINIYDKNEVKNINCLRLQASNSEKFIDILKKSYNFKNECPYKLTFSTKSQIVCNSPYNSDKKMLNDFPTSFVKFEIYKEAKLIYSYYLDLLDKPTPTDVEKNFKKMCKNVGLKQ